MTAFYARSKVMVCSAALLTGLTGGVAHAQSSAAVAVEEIVVTATMRKEKLQEVPIAITAVTQSQLRNLNLSNVTDLSRLAPSLRITQGSRAQSSTISVRGVSTQVNTLTLDNSVGVSLDGVPLARNSEAFAQLVDVERIEVLRGPQGTLLGKNASAGLISIVTRRPELGKVAAWGRVSYGSYNELRTEGALNVPLGDKVAFRVAGWNFQHDGFIKNLTTGDENDNLRSSGARVKARFQPSDALDVTLTAGLSRNTSNGPASTTRSVVTDPLGIRAAEAARGIVFGPKNLLSIQRQALPTLSKTDTREYTAQIDYHMKDFLLTSITSFHKVRQVFSFDALGSDDPRLSPNYNNNKDRYHQLTQEVRLTSPQEARLRYVFGGFYSKLHLDSRQDQAVFPPLVPAPISRRVLTTVDSESIAAYGNATFDITDKIRAAGGVRYTHDTTNAGYDRSYFVTPAAVIPALNGAGAPFGPFSATAGISTSKVTATGSLNYQFSRDAMVYATVSTGYKAGGSGFSLDTGAAIMAANGAIVQPETSLNRELGVKSQWFDQRLTLNVAAYYETFKNFQTGARIVSVVPVFSIVNAKELESKGVEVEFSARPADGLTVSGFVTYTDAKFTDFPNAPCFVGQTVAEGCVNTIQSLTGVNLSATPKWTASATARYEHDLSAAFTGFGQVNYSYVGAQTYQNSRDPYEQQDDYSIVNLTAGVSDADGKWTFSVYANNIFESGHVGSVINTSPVGRNYIQYPLYEGQRTFGAAVQFNY